MRYCKSGTIRDPVSYVATAIYVRVPSRTEEASRLVYSRLCCGKSGNLESQWKKRMAIWMWAKCGQIVASDFPSFSLCAHVHMYVLKKSITEALLQRGELLKNDATYLSRKCT